MLCLKVENTSLNFFFRIGSTSLERAYFLLFKKKKFLIRSLDRSYRWKRILQLFQTFYSKSCSRLARVVSLTHTITFPKICIKKIINRFSAIIVEREKNIARSVSLARHFLSLSLSRHCLSKRYSKNRIF